MLEILRATIDSKKIVSLCVGKVDWDKRIIGYVKSINNRYITIDVVDIFGSVIKRRKIAIGSIAVVEVNDSYNNHLERLKVIGKYIKKSKPIYHYNRGSKFKEKLELLRFKETVCTFFFGTEYLTGIVKKINEETLFINSVGYRGTKEGESYFKIRSITKIRYDGPLEKKISYLQQE